MVSPYQTWQWQIIKDLITNSLWNTFEDQLTKLAASVTSQKASFTRSLSLHYMEIWTLQICRSIVISQPWSKSELGDCQAGKWHINCQRSCLIRFTFAVAIENTSGSGHNVLQFCTRSLCCNYLSAFISAATSANFSLLASWSPHFVDNNNSYETTTITCMQQKDQLCRGTAPHSVLVTIFC